MKNKYLMLIVAVVVLTATGCATTPPYDPFKVDQENFFSTTKIIALAPIAVPASLAAAEHKASQFEPLVANKLQEASFSVVRSDEYRDIWKRENEQVGGCFDPVTGRMDVTKYRAVQDRTCRELAERFNADAILLLELVVVKANFMSLRAEWDGAEESFDARHGFTKFMDMIGGSSKQGTVGALSLRATIKDIDGNALFVNRGGIQVLARYVTRGFDPIPVNELLTNEERNAKAVDIALAPLLRTGSAAETTQE